MTLVVIFGLVCFVSLSSIIAARREQANFQLVVITHDQEFVNMMGRSDHVDNYLLLKRVE